MLHAASLELRACLAAVLGAEDEVLTGLPPSRGSGSRQDLGPGVRFSSRAAVGVSQNRASTRSAQTAPRARKQRSGRGSDRERWSCSRARASSPVASGCAKPRWSESRPGGGLKSASARNRTRDRLGQLCFVAGRLGAGYARDARSLNRARKLLGQRVHAPFAGHTPQRVDSALGEVQLRANDQVLDRA
jgi:hypothetical protein